MTDITELAKAAEKYRSTLDAHRNNPRDGVALNAWDDATSKFMELVDNDELNIISGLLEALEKAQQRIAELENYAEAEAAGADRAAEDGVYWMKRCKEMESRTVKLPEPFKLAKSSSGLTYYYADEVDAAITAAGIKVEAE